MEEETKRKNAEKELKMGVSDKCLQLICFVNFHNVIDDCTSAGRTFREMITWHK